MADAQQLKAHLGILGAVIGPGDETYEASLRGWSDVVIVQPKTAADIASVVKYARRESVDLAVRGGGHSTSGTSSTEGGILIDLGKEMTSVVVDPDAPAVTVQGGATWGDVSKAIAKYALAVNGGTVSRVGVGGLSLQGGYGYFAPQHGVVLDTITAAKVVTGTGDIVTASPQENPDLFWAIRGAGMNVGVVYELTFQAYPKPNLIWYGIRAYPADEVQNVTEALNKALFHPQGKAAAQLLLHLSPEDGKTPIVSTVLFFDGSEQDAHEHFSALLKVRCTKDEMQMRHVSETNTVLDPLVPPGGRKMEIGFQMSLPPRPAFVKEMFDCIVAKLTQEPDLSHSSVEIDYFDPSRICRVPVSATAFATRVRLLHATSMLQWSDATRDEEFISWAHSIRNMAERELLSHGQKQHPTTSNFIDYTPDNKLSPSEMFGENAGRLLQIKAKYDPANLFNKQNPIV
ncbi:FAD binding domain protein [Aspergillus ustus]|uniref:FAD binding domain protein n=1 Tax=Aspergillus ustus TaxID=40382 RepID=A0A0C1C3S6_ASPUT|nr:FAD binding domain protein [Aspergillus ustus]